MAKLVTIKNNLDEPVCIADINREAIENLIKSASLCRQIEAIILFGSSLEEQCTDKSDIDIAIIHPKGVEYLDKLKSFRKLMDALYDYDMEKQYDRLYFKSIQFIEDHKDTIPICREIYHKGKLIYQKKNEVV